MGCVAIEADQVGITLYSSKSPLINNLSDKQKDKLSDLIEVDDMLTLAVAMDQLGAQPNSEISDSQMKWMLTHLCCRWDSDNSLEYLLKDYFIQNPNRFVDFINAPTVQGYTLLHLCAMWKSEKCFYVLHHYGGLNLNAKDRLFKNPTEYAIEYKCAKMKDILLSYRDLGINFTQVETEKLLSGDLIAEDVEVQNKNRMLMSSQKVLPQNQISIKIPISEEDMKIRETKKRLQKEREELLELKFKQQVDANIVIFQRSQQNDEQVEGIVEWNKEDKLKQIRKQVQESLFKQQEKVDKQLKAKQQELIRIKEEIKKKEEERIRKQKQDVQKKTQLLLIEKRDQLNKKIKEKSQKVVQLKKKEEEKVKKQKEETTQKIKLVEEEFIRKQAQVKKSIKLKQEQVQKIKKDEHDRLKQQTQNAHETTKQSLEQAERDFKEKVKKKQEEIKQFQQQQSQRLKKQKEEAERLAVETSKIANSKIEIAAKKKQQEINKINNQVQDISTYLTSLKEAYKKARQDIPQNIISIYTEAKNTGRFVDKQFPANDKSIGDASKANFKNLTKDTVWLRPKDIFRGNFQLFDGIDPNDVKQGSLGVCYMLATISSLAVNPKNIEKIFIFSDTFIGFYILEFYINGKPKLVIVDDQIPCNKTTKSPLFTKPIGNQVWVLLLQKAWAKMIGDYLSAESMTPDHMMEDLSSAPGYGSWFEKDNKPNLEHIKKIVDHSNQGHIVVITSGDKKIEGIPDSHAYTVLKVFNAPNGRYLFRIRNPWGHFEWNGQYGDKSTLWTPQLKKLCNFEEKDDGIFHISESQLTHAFCYYSISQIQNSSCYAWTEFKSQKDEDLFYKIRITKPGEFNIRVTQIFDRMIKDSSYKYSPLVFEIGKILPNKKIDFISQGNQKTYFGAKSVHAFENIIQKLDEGDYFIRIRMLWKDDKKYNTAILAVYGHELVAIQKLDQSTGLEYMKQLFISQAQSIKKNLISQTQFYKISTMKGQFVFIGETDSDSQFKIQFKFTKNKMQYCEADINKKSDIQLEVQTKRGEPGIATMKRTEPASGGQTGPMNIQTIKG